MSEKPKAAEVIHNDSSHDDDHKAPGTFVLTLILLLSAVWLGLNFANRLVAPIRRLITAADLVASGNLFVQVPVRRSEGDLASLGESFNKMTHELRTQRDDLVRAAEGAVAVRAGAEVAGPLDRNGVVVRLRHAASLGSPGWSWG